METKNCLQNTENCEKVEENLSQSEVTVDMENSENIGSPNCDVDVDVDDVDVVENDAAPATNLTNFSIHEILKPDFGAKKFSVRSMIDDVNDDITTSTRRVIERQQHRQHHPNHKEENRYHYHHHEEEKQQHFTSSESDSDERVSTGTDKQRIVWPAWVYCTRYSDRPSSGPRNRKLRRKDRTIDEKRPRTAFSAEQLDSLRREFDDCRYLTEQRRRDLSHKLQLSESQIKIWFQNKRAKLKKTSGHKNPLALHLMAQGLYNHCTAGDVTQS